MQKSLTRRLLAGHTRWLAVSHTPENISSTLLMTYYNQTSLLINNNPNLWRGSWGLDQFEAISLWWGQRLKWGESFMVTGKGWQTIQFNFIFHIIVTGYQ